MKTIRLLNLQTGRNAKGKENQKIMVHKNLPALAFVFVLTVVALLAMSPKVLADTITTSIGPNSYWPLYSVVGQTQAIIVQIAPVPNYYYEYGIYRNCNLSILDPNGNRIEIIIDSDSLGYAHFEYRPVFVGSYSLQFYMPEQVVDPGELAPVYTSILSIIHIWNVTPPLNVSVSPSSQNAVVGQSMPFAASASGGTPPYTYQWFEGSTIVGTSSALSISKNAVGTYSFYCRVNDSKTLTVISSTVTLVVSPPLNVSVSPSSQNAVVGQSMPFAASASGGTPPYTYQWFEGSTIVGTSSTLSISKNAVGTYSFYCRVNDSKTLTVISSTVTLVVSPPLNVSVSPSSQNAVVGQSMPFAASASGGTPPYTYQWFEGSTIVGTSSTLSISKNAVGTYSFYCRVNDSKTLTVISSTVTLVVSPPLNVSVSPSSQNAVVGQSMPFAASASGGTPPYTYQWFEGSTIVGTSSTLSISKNAVGTYSFYCRVNDSKTLTVISSTVTLVVSPPLNVSVSPSSQNAVVGQSMPFAASASGGTPPYTYQWFEGSTIVGTSSTLSISKNAVGTYSFYCRVNDSKTSTLNSNSVTFTVTPPPHVTPPQTEILLSGTIGENDWYTSDVLITLLASDEVGVLNTGYSFDNVAWLTYTAPFTITSEGKITVYYKSTDTSHNVESTKTREVNIDKTPPNGTLLINNGAELTNTTEVVLALSASDITSGIYQMQFSNDGTEYCPWQVCGASFLWTLQNGTGQKTVYAQFKDQAGLTSIFSDSIALEYEISLSIYIYIVAAVAVAAIISAVAYTWVRNMRSSRSHSEEKVKVPPPLFSKLRWIQAQVFELSPRGKQKIRRTNALRANAPHSLNVRIGPADQEWLTPPEESALPEDRLTWKNGVSHLQVVFSEPNHSPEPQIREIILPREGSSTTCRFNFNPRSEVPYFKGRVIVLNGNRVVQTALLEGKVVPEPDHSSDFRLQFTVESVIQPNLGDLSSRRAFDLAFVANHTVDNSPAVVTICHEQAYFNNLKNIEIPIKEITRILEKVVERPDDFPKSMEDDRNVRWLRDLAINGRGLYGGIVVDQIGEKRVEKINRVQLVSTVDEYLPLEFIYDLPAPDFQARLCPKWREALEKGPEELEEGLCKDCKIKRSLSPAEFLCPLGFWGLRLVVERHYIDPYNKPDLKGYAFALKGESVEGRRGLRVLKSAIFAASEKVDEVVPQSQDVFKVLQDVTHQKVEQVTTLESWRDAVMKLQPSLLVLLTHISSCSLDPRQPQMEIGKGVGLAQIYINRQYLVPSEEAPRPVVLLLGCTTLSTNIPFRSFAASFRREGASIVLSTITDVLGRHIAPVTAQLVHNLEEAAEKGLSMGDALVLVRRRALADGIPVVLSLVGIGDADWRFETVEVN